MKDAEKAEETTQDIFMRIWKNRERLAAMENFPGCKPAVKLAIAGRSANRWCRLGNITVK